MRIRPGLDLPAFLLAGVWLGLAVVSHRDNGVRVLELFAALGAAWALTLWAWWNAGSVACSEVVARAWFWGVVFRLIGFFGLPILEDDYFRYLWDGRMFALTGNPYAQPPAAFFGATEFPAPFGGILDQINYPDVPTIYGPVLQYLFWASYKIVPGELWPLKLFLLTVDLAVLRLLQRTHSPRAVLLWAWCPLLIQEVAFSAHPEIVGVALLVGSLAALSQQRPALASGLAGAAVAAKVVAVIMVPLILWKLPRRFWLVSVAVMAALYLPFWAQGSAADWAGLAIFLRDWEFNSSLFPLARGWLGEPVGRAAILALFTLVWLFLFRRWARTTDATWPRGDMLFGAFLLCSATVNPWYLLWLLPFVAIRPTAAGFTAMAAVSLSYATFGHLGTPGALWEHPAWVRPVEYGLVLLALGVACAGRGKTLRAGLK